MFISEEVVGVLRERGFVQLSECPLPPMDDPFVVRVSVPLFLGDVPFYLYISNEDQSFEFVVADDGVVQELMTEMNRDADAPDTAMCPFMFCWAEVLERGEINFDTKTPCPGFQW